MRLVAVRLCPGHTYPSQVSCRIDSFFIAPHYNRVLSLSKIFNPETPKCLLLQEAVKTELSGSLRQFAPRLAANGTPFPAGMVDDATIPILAVVNDMGADVEVGYGYKFVVTCPIHHH